MVPKDGGRWCCLGTPHIILECMSIGGTPVSKRVKPYFKSLARLGVQRGWFSYVFIPEEPLRTRLQELLGQNREISTFIQELYVDSGGHA